MNFTRYHILYCFILLAGIFYSADSAAQYGRYDTIKVHAIITSQDDTIPAAIIPPYTLYSRLSRSMRKRYVEWTRLRNAVYVTYPYAIKASKIINEINARLVNVKDKKQRKAIIHSREKELKKEFADKLTSLSTYQGRVLMKLIYRETGNNCYEIIEEYKGFFTAAFWQTVAVIFGNNLKQDYDPLGEDQEMEAIVKEVQKMYR